ncbi:trichohyalin-like [Procambarus clarkii]|uniref:trichohyalin-like n=1 Tax=Procambarus clarkii TaxID=6728 RepID=UPI0037426457
MKMQLEAQLKREESEHKAQMKQEEREAQLEREEREREAQLKQEEREAQLKREEREAQLQQEEGERQQQREEIKAKEVKLRRIEHGLPSLPARRDDLKAQERDLPTFDPLQTEAFFDHFERITTLKEWPEEDWAVLVQSRLTGEAREAYYMLDVKECAIYNTIKKAVLHSYRLTPEVYRRCFRECARASGRSYAETARDMERRFLRWLKAEEVETMEELKQLILMEKFMSMLHLELKVRVREAGIKDLKAAEERADMLEEALHLRKKGPPRHSSYPRFGGNFKRSGEGGTGGDSPKSSLPSEVIKSKSSGEPITLTSPLELDRVQLGELHREEFPELIQEAGRGGRTGPEIPTHFYLKEGMLMRQWRPVRMEADMEALGVKRQVVLPIRCRGTLLDLAQSVDLGGHLGVTKTLNLIRGTFLLAGNGCRRETPLQNVSFLSEGGKERAGNTKGPSGSCSCFLTSV